MGLARQAAGGVVLPPVHRCYARPRLLAQPLHPLQLHVTEPCREPTVALLFCRACIPASASRMLHHSSVARFRIQKEKFTTAACMRFTGWSVNLSSKKWHHEHLQASLQRPFRLCRSLLLALPCTGRAGCTGRAVWARRATCQASVVPQWQSECAWCSHWRTNTQKGLHECLFAENTKSFNVDSTDRSPLSARGRVCKPSGSPCCLVAACAAWCAGRAAG